MGIQVLIVKCGTPMRGPQRVALFHDHRCIAWGPADLLACDRAWQSPPLRLPASGGVGTRAAFDYNPTMALDTLVSALVTLLVVVDPVGLTPTFLAVTQGLPGSARRQSALRACLIAGAILAGTALIGDWLLDKLAITLPAFRIAGGLLLFAVASEMVFGVRIERQSKQ